MEEATTVDKNEDDGVDGVEDDAERQPELDRIDDGADALTVLQDRLSRSQAAQDVALQELRAVMSDEDALDRYGIDTSRV